MKQIIITLIIAILAISSVSAIDCNSIADDVMENDVKFPGAIPFKNERVNLFVNDTPNGYAILEDRVVTEFSCNESLEDYTYNVKLVSWDIIDEIASTEKVADRLNKAFKEKEIVLEGKTAGKKFKGFMTRMAVKIGSWFS